VRIKNEGEAPSDKVTITVTYPGTDVTGKEIIEGGIDAGETVDRPMNSPTVVNGESFTTFIIRVVEGDREHASVESDCYV
jgi:hypothetical protein